MFLNEVKSLDMKLAKQVIIYTSVVLTVGLTTWSCKHEAGVLDKCLGKNITLDTTQTILVPNVDTTVKPAVLGEILIDTTFVKADIKKRPYYGSIDGGISGWHLLPLDTLLPKGTYHLVIKDGDGCLSEVYSQNITY